MAAVHPQQSPQQQNNSMDRRASLASSNSNSSNNGSPFNDSSQGLVIAATTKKGGHQPQKLYLPDLTLALPGNKNAGQPPNFLTEKKLTNNDLEGKGNESKKVR